MKKYMGWKIGLCCLLCSLTGLCDNVVPKHQWTFKFEAPNRVYATGLKKSPKHEAIALDLSFRNAEGAIPGAYDLTTVANLSPVLDQSSCGSCVYHSVTSNFADSFLLRAQDFGGLNKLSAEFLMTSPLDQGGRCGGSYFMATGPATANGMPLFSDCPYAMGRRGCPSGTVLHGKSVSVKLIDPSPKSIATALAQKYPVSNTIGANGTFQGYSQGIFNACSNVGTNHETEIVGYDCETAKDGQGNCAFDQSGNLPAGVGYWKIRNSWGTGWGEQGFYRIKMTDARGRRCNNVAEEVGIIETGITPPTPKPPEPPAPVIPWGLILKILQGIGALSGVVALIVILVRKKD